MSEFTETDISRAIIDAYHDRLSAAVESDVLIVGAGPSGMTAAFYLARAGRKVVVIEKRLSPGGGVWGGAMGMNVVVVQDAALPVLDEMGVRHRPVRGELHLVDAAELACGLTERALRAGAVLLNLTCLEDVSVHGGRVTGAVVNRTTLHGSLPVDPITLRTEVLVDATGHDACAVEKLTRRGLIKDLPAIERHREGPMDAARGEAFVMERVAEVFPGLWVVGMSVCAAYGGPRMGPIFGGMVLSGHRLAALLCPAIGRSAEKKEREDLQPTL
jgi:thiamine thiazole synthase